MMSQSKWFHFLLVLALFWAVHELNNPGARESGAIAALLEQSQPYITTRDVSVRSGPGNQYKIVAEIKSGTKVNVAGREAGWLKIVSKHGNPPGYINEKDARPLAEQAKPAPPPVQGPYMTTEETYVREGAGLHYKVVAKIPKGVKVHVVGAEGDWLKVQSKHGNPPGYIEKKSAQRSTAN